MHTSHHIYHFCRLRFDFGAGTAENESATFCSTSSLRNRAVVVDVTRRNKPLPTTLALMYACRSLLESMNKLRTRKIDEVVYELIFPHCTSIYLSLMAGVSVVKDAWYKVAPVIDSFSFFIFTSVGVPYILL